MTADLIITKAAILTMDSAKPRAEAVAIAGNKMIAVGTTAEVAAHKGGKTRVIDAGGNIPKPQVPLVCAGSTTAAAVQAHGLQVDAISAQPTPAVVADTIHSLIFH